MKGGSLERGRGEFITFPVIIPELHLSIFQYVVTMQGSPDILEQKT